MRPGVTNALVTHHMGHVAERRRCCVDGSSDAVTDCLLWGAPDRVIDVLVSACRDAATACRFFQQSLTTLKVLLVHRVDESDPAGVDQL